MGDFKSKKEFLQAMLDGKTVNFYGEVSGGNIAYLDEDRGFVYVRNGVTEALAFNCSDWKGATLKQEWYENITKPVLCWVSDVNSQPHRHVPTDACAGLIVSYDTTRCNRNFRSGDIGWRYATPVVASDLLGVDNE